MDNMIKIYDIVMERAIQDNQDIGDNSLSISKLGVRVIAFHAIQEYKDMIYRLEIEAMLEKQNGNV